jgi:UDP-N-acetylmuramate-alanine ligase
MLKAWQNSPLMEAILDLGLPYTSGPRWLSEYVLHTAQAPFHVLAVAGTHGKTTTASMLAWILEFAQKIPRIPDWRRTARILESSRQASP